MREPVTIGTRFERLQVVGPAPKDKKGQRYWMCQCDCGTLKSIAERHLWKGTIRSCGCLRREVSQMVNRSHGLSKIPEYKVYRSIKNRCNNPHDLTNYPKYGGRGIQCLWMSFEAFYADMGPRPGPKYTIERRDNDGHYSPENCRWATSKEQALNKRNTHFLTLHDTTQTLSQWSQETGIGHSTILRRKGLGWSDEEALTISPSRYKHGATRRKRQTIRYD